MEVIVVGRGGLILYFILGKNKPSPGLFIFLLVSTIDIEKNAVHSPQDL